MHINYKMWIYWVVIHWELFKMIIVSTFNYRAQRITFSHLQPVIILNCTNSNECDGKKKVSFQHRNDHIEDFCLLSAFNYHCIHAQFHTFHALTDNNTLVIWQQIFLFVCALFPFECIQWITLIYPSCIFFLLLLFLFIYE